MNELVTTSDKAVEYSLPTVSFPGFDAYMTQANSIADYLSTMEVTEENLKGSKKILSEARKVIDRLDANRKAVKKDLLRDYEAFETQIKRIQQVIASAENTQRKLVRELEEKERKEKERQVRNIFDLRVPHYSIHDLLPDSGWSFFWKAKYANKTQSMNETEREMVQFLESTETDLETLSTMNGTYTAEYLLTLNLQAAITSVNKRNELRKAVEAQEEEAVCRFIVKGKLGIKAVENFLIENEIKFTKE